MRDIELFPANSDNAYLRPSPGGLPAVVTATDPAFSDTKAYSKVSLGGEFAPGRRLILSAPTDGGEANLAADLPVTPYVNNAGASVFWPGRSQNQATFQNLYPWKKTPPQGMDWNNPVV